MKLRVALGLIVMFCGAEGALADAPPVRPPMPPWDIIKVISRIEFPHVEFRSTTVKEALDFLYRKYDTVILDPPPDTTFVFEYRLPDAILQQHITFEAKDITILEALKRTLRDVPVVITFESGRVILSQASPPP